MRKLNIATSVSPSAAMMAPEMVHYGDAHFVSKLLVDARAVSDAFDHRVDFILEKLAERLDLKLAVFGRVRIHPGNPVPELVQARRVSRMSPEELGVMHAYYTDMNAQPDPALVVCVELLKQAPGPIAIRRVDLINDEAWYASTNVKNCRHPGGVDDQILAGAPRDSSGLYIATSFHRAWGAPGFTQRDRDLIFLLQNSVDWIFADYERQLKGEGMLAALTPARLAVLSRLVIGDSAKQVATNVGISVHAVNQQIKAIHKIFGVASRGELLSRCFSLCLSPEKILHAMRPAGRVAFPVDQDPEYRQPKSGKNGGTAKLRKNGRR